MKNGKIIFESKKNELTSFIEPINIHNQELSESSVTDKVVGKAVALLGAYTKINSIYASTLSVECYDILRKYSIKVRYNNMTERIVNNQGTDLCPFEKSVIKTNELKEAFSCIKTAIQVYHQDNKHLR